MKNKTNHIYTFKNILKSEGLRYTKQRQRVWDGIKSSSEHRDAEKIYFDLNKNNDIKVSRATVYRTIDVLVKNNLVRKMDLGNGRALYEHKINAVTEGKRLIIAGWCYDSKSDSFL